mgnify:CR=1 FL=1
MLEISSKTNLLEQKSYKYSLQDVAEPNLQRDVYSYGTIPKVAFNHRRVPMSMPEEIWITDTSLRDGQQSVEPYTVNQIVDLYKMLSRLGGPKGIIRQTEFFVYSQKDREAVRRCQDLGYAFPEITTWIRATREDFRMVKDLGIKETGILVSCSDYHIFKKMQMTRRQALDYYLATVKDAFDAGVMPRCHLEDITRADFYGFVVPFVNELMELSHQAKIPVRIRACDTMGYGVPYTEVALPRSVPGIIYGLQHYSGVESEYLEWHGHNDFYKAVANAATAWLYGASGVNCSMLGIGERTGNVDAVTLAMNLYSHGVDPRLDFSDMPAICAAYERVTRMHIYERTPYAGQLVFAAFSGSHQDAIAKGMAYRKERGEHRWTCPYIPIDPHDIGRTYDADVIRINSQSGKGGIGFVLEQNYGYNLPPKMREVLGYKVKSVSDHSHKELSAGEVLRIFEESFLNREKPLRVVEAHFAQVNGITATVTLDLNGQRKVVTSVGNGRLDAVANAIQSATGMDFHLESYSEHSLDEGSTSRAASYVGLAWGDGSVTWGAGTDTDIIVAGIKALVSAINSK